MIPHPTDLTTPEALTGEEGFTLVEMMAVMLIVVMLGTAVFLSVSPQIGRSKAVKARSDINTLSSAVEMYNLTMGEYPEELGDLVVPPRDADLAAQFPKGGFVQVLRPDPWKNDYIYTYPGENGIFDIATYGADGEPGGEGEDADIVSWQ